MSLVTVFVCLDILIQGASTFDLNLWSTRTARFLCRKHHYSH